MKRIHAIAAASAALLCLGCVRGLGPDRVRRGPAYVQWLLPRA